MDGRVMLKPVWVVVHSDALKFEDECQELIKQGYKLVTASCGTTPGSESYAPEPYYQAIFALPGAVIDSPCAAGKLGQCSLGVGCVHRNVGGGCAYSEGSSSCAFGEPDWCPLEDKCVYRDADGTCTHPKGSYSCAIPPRK